MKFKIFFFLLGLSLCFSCSQYQKVLNGEELEPKVEMAFKLYEEGKYRKALRLWEQIVPGYRGKPQAENVMFKYADTYYQLGDNITAAYQFELFTKAYPSSEKQEEAFFKLAKSYFKQSPKYTLDQEPTKMSLSHLQAFINRYPNTEFLQESNEMVKILNQKLERKAYSVAKQYHHMERWLVAMTAFDNFIFDFPGTPYKEDAMFYKFDAQYQYAAMSLPSKRLERMDEAVVLYEDFIEQYPESKYRQRADNLLKKIKISQQELQPETVSK